MITVGHASIRDATRWMLETYEDAGRRGGLVSPDKEGVLHVPAGTVVGDEPWVRIEDKLIYQWLDEKVYAAWRAHMARSN